MTPKQKLKHAILLKAHLAGHIHLSPDVGLTDQNVDDLYEEHDDDGLLYDARSELRCSGEETNIPAPYSRHYESDSVAAKMPDGSWVGWTYWYGGGNYSDPDDIPWMEDAYDLTCTEEQITVTKRTFARVPA